ncbi:MAG: glycosyltransferase 36 associated protein, partial [Candidatus Eisenbacteria bacterium]
AQLGNGDEAMDLFHMLNPINHARTPADVNLYKVEPYVVAADVYTHVPHIGRGGWTWYTGSAAWMYRVGLESILGLHRQGTSFSVAPCVPAAWKQYLVRWRLGATLYEITVENPQRRSHGVSHVTLDGAAVSRFAIPIIDDGALHRVHVVMGDAKVVQALRSGG